MKTLHLSTRSKQTIVALIFLGSIALTFFATKAFAVSTEEVQTTRSKPSLYDNYIKAKPAQTTTTTTTTTVKPSVVVKAVPITIPTPPVQIPSGDIWEALRNCEAGGNYSTNTGNGYFGAYQFSQGTWNSMNTGYAFAHEAPPEVQDDAAKRLQERSGWGQWPSCTKQLGLR